MCTTLVTVHHMYLISTKVMLVLSIKTFTLLTS